MQPFARGGKRRAQKMPAKVASHLAAPPDGSGGFW